MLDVAVIISNYLHDVATAFLLASALVVWVLGRRSRSGDADEARMLASALPALRRIAWGALAWIVVGGIPRTIFFTRYEWDPALVKGLLPALIVKHVLMVTAVVVGALMWRSMSRHAAAVEVSPQSASGAPDDHGRG